MTTGWLRGGAVGVLVVGAFATAPFVGGRAQEAPPLLPPPSLEERVILLERIVAKQQADLDHLYRIADGLVAGAERLAVAADQARLLGFEAAGANPDARTELLQGLWTFQATVAQAAAPPPPPAEPEGARAKSK